eukprot:2633434-Pleurochrysis_carterae.AAC.3
MRIVSAARANASAEGLCTCSDCVERASSGCNNGELNAENCIRGSGVLLGTLFPGELLRPSGWATCAVPEAPAKVGCGSVLTTCGSK